MDKIVGVVSKAPQTRTQNDDDFADRLSSRYTVVLLVVFAVLVSMNQVSYGQFSTPSIIRGYHTAVFISTRISRSSVDYQPEAIAEG